MFVRTVNGGEGTDPGQPLPAPPRWHLRTQVSRKTLFDLIQDTLPPGGLQVTGPASDMVAPEAAEAGAANLEPTAGIGVLPQHYLDPSAATIPISLDPGSLWADSDTSPDVLEHCRPITITLASQNNSFSPPPVAALGPVAHPLQAAAKRAGWMLSGVALTFLVSAAAFGGGPMIQAVRAVVSRSQARASTTDVSRPAPAPAPTIPSRAPAGDEAARRALVAVVDPMPPKSRPAATGLTAHRAPEAAEAGDPDLDNGSLAADRKVDATRARRPRSDRRIGRMPLSASDRAEQALRAGEDAVLPLDSASPAARPAPTRTTTASIAKTLGSRSLRPIDVEDPFRGP